MPYVWMIFVDRFTVDDSVVDDSIFKAREILWQIPELFVELTVLNLIL